MSIADQEVEPQHLSLSTRALFYARGVPLGPWESGYRYRKLDLVTSGASAYIAMSDHVSSESLVNDISAGRWMVFQESGHDVRLPETVQADLPVFGNADGTAWEQRLATDARTALGVSATGADTTYAARANNLSDLADPEEATGNLLAPQGGTGGVALFVDTLLSATLIFPERFGAVGDGVTTDDTAITNWLAWCADNGRVAELWPGKTYALSGSFAGTIRCPFRGNGGKFVTTNGGQSSAVFDIESLAADIETLTLTEVNTWTGLYRGSRQIPELTERGWAYALSTTDENFLDRNGGGSVPKGVAFDVVSDDGHLSVDLRTPFTDGAFTDVTASRRRIRERMTVEGLVVELMTGSSSRNKVIRVLRPNTRLVACEVINSTATDVGQGFVHNFGNGLVYEACAVDGMAGATTNYGWNGGYIDDVTFIACRARYCRRAIDSHGASSYKIIGGNFPDGIGAHWVDGFYVGGKAFISQRDATNLQCIQIAGSDVDIDSARIHVPLGCRAVLGMREDVPELRGLCRLGPGVEIEIDENGDTAGVDVVTIVDLPIASYDAGRTVLLPGRIEIKPGRIVQRGASSDNRIELLGTDAKTNANFPQDIQAPTSIEIDVGAFALQGTYDSYGDERLLVTLAKSDNQIGDPCKVYIRNIQRLEIASPLASASADTADGRFDVELVNVQDASTLSFQVGAVRNYLLTRVNASSTITTTGGGGSAVGDEQGRWDVVVENGAYTPTWTSVANVDGTPTGVLSRYTVSREGPRTFARVWGLVSVDPTATSTLTTLRVTLPIASNFANVQECVGAIRATAGNCQGGIVADTTNDAALVNFISIGTAAISMYYDFEYEVLA